MTHRERAEARLARRREWAAGRSAKAAACYAVGDPYRGDVAFNTQPGHIPERARVIRAMEKSFEHSNMAAHHDAKADGIERQLERTIFSDDENAVEAIQEKVARGRASLERMKAANKIIRKHKADQVAGKAALVAQGFTEAQAEKLYTHDCFGQLGFPSYATTNLGANLRRLEGRIVEIERMAARKAQAEAAPGGVVIEGAEWVRVTFAEKPERTTLDTLKAAGFTWGGGSWTGKRENIPAGIV